MRKRMVTAVGIIIGVVALVAVACSQPDVTAPASTDSPGSNVTAPRSTSNGETTGSPVSSQPPVSILDTINPEECNFVHNINACFTDDQPPAGIPLGEYTGLFMMARDHLERFGISTASVKILDVEKADWGDASLGNPEPGIMYAQVITPGFKMSLAADGSTYMYHTSMDRVVFVGQPWRVDIRGFVTAVQRTDAQNSGNLAFGRTIGSILVEGAIEDDTAFDKARLRVTDKTRIFQQSQGERQAVTFDSLNIGKALAKVEVQFTIGPVAESYPIQATAAEIVILSQSSGGAPPATDADVTERDKAEIVSETTGKNLPQPLRPVIRLHYGGQVYNGGPGNSCWPVEPGASLCADEGPFPWQDFDLSAMPVTAGDSMIVDIEADDRPQKLQAAIFTMASEHASDTAVQVLELDPGLKAALAVDLPAGIYNMRITGQWGVGDQAYKFRIKVE